jgi:cysteine-rich repeat protein
VKKSIISKFAVVSLVSLVAGGAFSACSSEGASPSNESVEEADLTRVNLNLNVPEGHTVSSIHYDIFAGTDVDGTPPAVESADTDVSSNKATGDAFVYLAPGTYTAVLTSATDAPDSIPCMGQATFTVLGGATTNVSVALTCIDPTAPVTGGANIDASFTFTHPTCGLTEVFVGPLTQMTPGSEFITLQSEATVGATYSWTVLPATLGTITSPTAPDTTFDCTAVGDGTLSITVANAAENCSETKTVAIECATNDVCGNGTVESTEACEPPTANCNPTTCQFYECGDGSTNGSEQCDDGDSTSGDGCSATCVTEFCGDGVINNTTEECDGAPVGGVACLADCSLEEVVAPQTCAECTTSACGALEGLCDAAENTDATNGNRCRNLLSCYETSACALDVDPVVCTCGTFAEIDCAGGEADGACLAVARRSAGTNVPLTNNASVLNTLLRFNNADYPIGDANLLSYCQIANCDASCAQY